MTSQSANQYTGYRSTGFRFRFHVRSIARPCLFLPLEMKSIPEIRRLLDGESPLAVFDVSSIHSARKAFNDLRKKFDFSFWAVNEYYISDLYNADCIVPLKLNTCQEYLIDILEKRYHNRQPGRYVVSKSLFPCGLTTCVQAYITWLQTFRCQNHSYTCSSSDINLHPLKRNLCRWLGRDIVPSEKWLFIPKAGQRAFFNTFRSPDFVRGINIGYVHFADMSKWKDSVGKLTCQTINASVSGVLLDYFTLVIFEGNIPKKDRFDVRKHQDFTMSPDERLKTLSRFSSNPHFLNYVALASSHSTNSPFIHIDLNDSFFPERHLHIPLKHFAPY